MKRHVRNIANKVGILSDEQKYLLDGNYTKKNFITAKAGDYKTIKGGEEFAILTGVEFVFPEDCSYDFGNEEGTTDNQYTVRLTGGTQENSFEDEENDEEWAYRVFNNSDREIVRMSGPSEYGHFRPPQGDGIGLNVIEEDGQQRLRVSLGGTVLQVQEEEELSELKEKWGEFYASLSVEFLEDTYLQIDMNGSQVINLIFEEGYRTNPTKMEWKYSSDSDVFELDYVGLEDELE